MNRWKTAGSVTNEAEIIHFGGNVYVELHPRRWAPLISGRTSVRGGAPEHEGPGGGGDVMAFLFQPLTPQLAGRKEGPLGEGVLPAPGLSDFACHSTGNALI